MASLPAGGAEAGVGDSFVGQAAFAVGVDWAGFWEREVEVVGAPGVVVALLDGFVVGGVVGFAGGGGAHGEVLDGGDEVALVDLVHPAGAVAFDDGFAAAHFFEEVGAAGAVDAGGAHDDGAAGERFDFGLAQDAAGGAARFGGGVFVDEFAVVLAVDGGGGDEEGPGAGEMLGDLAHALEKNFLVGGDAASAGGGAVEDEVGVG